MMRHEKWLISLWVGLMVVAGGVQGTAFAAESFKVGVVDEKAVFERTKSGKKALEVLKEFAATRQRIITADDQELKSLKDQLDSQDAQLSESAKRDKAEQFRTKLESYQRRVQDFEREIREKERQIGGEFQRKLDEAAASVAEQGGFSLVFEKGNEQTLRVVLYNQQATDLTEQVIKELDRRNK